MKGSYEGWGERNNRSRVLVPVLAFLSFASSVPELSTFAAGRAAL